MASKEPINDENDDCFITIFVIQAVAQNVTVKMKNSSFIQVAKEIQKQTELTFLYNDAKVGNITGLNPDFTNTTDVKAVLEYCLKNSGLTFSIVDNTVVVSPVKLTSQQQENKLTVVGKISDQQGLPLPGVNIIIKGTTLGFVSDVEGKFTAICSRGDSLLSQWSVSRCKSWQLIAIPL